MTTESESMLWRWGCWSRENPRSEISVLGRVKEEGAGAGHISTKPEIYMPPSVELVEHAILGMEDEIKTAIILKYHHRKNSKDGGKELHCHPRHFNRLISNGICFVAGYLCAIGPPDKNPGK